MALRALLLAREREKNRAAMARVRALEEKQLAEKRYARKFIDRGGALGKFVQFGMLCRKASTSPLFENTVLVAIVVAGGLVALNTYDGMEESVGAKLVDGIVMTIFALEILLKLLAQHVRFWRYFVGEEWRWNNFDFLVFVFSLPVWDAFFDGSFVLALRLMRLMRFMKIIHKIPTLRLIIEGLIGGLSAVTAISLLLFLIFYLYAIVGEAISPACTARTRSARASAASQPRVFGLTLPPCGPRCAPGVTFFGANDPWHFASFRKAFVTLIRCATLEDWYAPRRPMLFLAIQLYESNLFPRPPALLPSTTIYDPGRTSCTLTTTDATYTTMGSTSKALRRRTLAPICAKTRARSRCSPWCSSSHSSRSRRS